MSYSRSASFCKGHHHNPRLYPLETSGHDVHQIQRREGPPWLRSQADALLSEDDTQVLEDRVVPEISDRARGRSPAGSRAPVAARGGARARGAEGSG